VARFIGNTMENEIKELKSMKAYKYFDIEESHNMEHKNKKETLKKYVRRLRLLLKSEPSPKNKMKAIETLASTSTKI
jgi:hypothetical protein